MKTLLRSVSALALALACAAPAAAQCSNNPRTGCMNASAGACRGLPRIGQRFAVGYRSCPLRGASQFVVVGTALRTPIRFRAPIACVRGGCTLACAPVLVALGTNSQVFSVPNNRALVGAEFCTQGGCTSRLSTGPCVFLHQRTTIKIMR